MNQIMPRNTVQMIVDYRNQALALYEDAFAKIEDADAAINAARAMWRRAAPNGAGRYYDGGKEIQEFEAAVKLPEKTRYLRTARKMVDCAVWDHIVTTTELERLMDKQAKDQLREQMRYIPDRVNRDGEIITDDEAAKGLPEVTVGNILATLEQFAGDADMIFRRGLANAFSKLDRRFRSHGGFKFGDRAVLTRAFDDSGRWCYGRHHQDTIADIERAFQILEAMESSDKVDEEAAKTNYTGICWLVDQERKTWKPMQSEHEGEFFRIKIYKNGNAHLWFTRKDLLEKANKILAEWYGEVIGDADTQEADPLDETGRKLTPAKNFGFFPTPDGAAEQLFSERWRDDGPSFISKAGTPPLRVLEPSAGTGNLAKRCADKDMPVPDEYMTRNGWQQRVTVDCVEIQPALAAALESSGIFNKVINADFLKMNPDPARLYDLIVMNPPFDRERDIDHVVWALRFLKPGGSLHAIMSAGTEFRETKKSKSFRALMEKWGAKWEDLPANSFAECGTNVNTLILRVTKPGKDA